MADKKISVSAKSRRLMIRETTTSYLFLAPFLVFFVMFVVYPMFMCVYTSFFDATMGREELQYISSAGLRVLKKTYMAAVKKNGTLELSHVNKMVMEVLEMTGFAGLLKIV